MPVDLWHLKERGPNDERLKSKRHGQGKRWRGIAVGPSGETVTRAFERKEDAKDWEAEQRAGVAPAPVVRRADRTTTFRVYGDRWRLAREIGWVVETRRRTESNLRNHLYPAFGDLPIDSITTTTVLEWLTRRLGAETPQSSLRLYFELFDAVMAAAVADKVISENPCDNIRLSQILRGLSRAPKWVPDEKQVVRLFDVVPERYHALLLLGAAQGCRISEALGLEDSLRCIEPERGELHVVQQLRYSPQHYGGFYMAPPKSGSSGTVDLDQVVADAIARHIKDWPPVEIELPDITTGREIARTARLIFTTVHGNPFTDRTWSAEWIKWRRKAGWPEDPNHSGFHALRHYFATTLIAHHADPKDVQRALRHKGLQITLETYVHWWPRAERVKGLIGAHLQRALGARAGG
ncbi:site-specific recombinase XerD [Krasilnikovia cinnamomea]|uniref:Site-specific recombinase XerD n=2 Tax=Krasilnikovia cinnamomea TaxID=349313 RepID=A0A4Q7ZJE1_9ACTN|nr:site-specific recombinase XerD [Krasilnikovia cinnamomea]